MTSTVVLNEGVASVIEVIPKESAIDSDLGEDFPGLVNGDWYCVSLERALAGETVPGVSDTLFERFSASPAALRRRFVVPRALVEPERAEQTIATLYWSKYSL